MSWNTEAGLVSHMLWMWELKLREVQSRSWVDHRQQWDLMCLASKTTLFPLYRLVPVRTANMAAGLSFPFF